MASMVKENHISLCFCCGGVGGILRLLNGCGGFPCKTTSHNHFTLYVNMTEVEITAV